MERRGRGGREEGEEGERRERGGREEGEKRLDLCVVCVCGVVMVVVVVCVARCVS